MLSQGVAARLRLLAEWSAPTRMSAHIQGAAP